MRSRLVPALLFTAVAVTVPIAAPAFAAPGTLSKWKFDETTQGATADDEAGVNDGTPGFDSGYAAPIPSTDLAPVSYTNVRSLSFDGHNYIQVDNPVSTDFTICAWVKTSGVGGGSNHWESAPIFDAEYGGVNFDFGFGIGNGGRLMYGNGGLDGGGNLYDMQINGVTPVNDNAWHNVCVTRDNSDGAVNLYVDAEVDGSGTTGMGALTVNPSARIGSGYDGAALYEGLIDELAIYDTVLTPAQVANISAGSEDPDGAPDEPPVATTAPMAGATTGTCRGLTPTIVAETGMATLGSAGDDVIMGTTGDDVIVSGGGDDVICGLGGDDTVDAGSGDDWVRADAGEDVLKGRRGDDDLRGSAGDDRVLAGRGKDRLTGSLGNDTVIGNRGDDNLNSGRGNDQLRGSKGDDRLSGGQGDDDLTGGVGTDWVCGGKGADKMANEPDENQYT